MYLSAWIAQLEPRIVVMIMVLMFIVIIFVSFITLLAKNYRRCPPNRLLVIYGKGIGGHSAAKVVHGGAVFVIPLMQDYAYLSLDPMQLELPKPLNARAAECGVKLPQTWTFAISTDPELMPNAAIRLLGLPQKEIEKLAADLITGRIQRKLDQWEDTQEAIDSASMVEKWAADVDADLAQVGLKTIGHSSPSRQVAGSRP